ncbi:hypothetical protein EDC04DRAFT_2625463, partial [Pisolithus marmoratus]
MMQRLAMAMLQNNLKYWNAWYYRQQIASLFLGLAFHRIHNESNFPRVLTLKMGHWLPLWHQHRGTKIRPIYITISMRKRIALLQHPRQFTLTKPGGPPPSTVNPFSFPTIPSLFQLLLPTSPFKVAGLIQHPLTLLYRLTTTRSRRVASLTRPHTPAL